MKKTVLLFLLLSLPLFTGCYALADNKRSTQETQTGAEDITMKVSANSPSLKNEYEVRNGTQDDTIAAPSDIPDTYDYGSGKENGFLRTDMEQKLPLPQGNSTLLNTLPDTSQIQALYLWEVGNMPARTEFTQAMTGHFDTYDFRPYVTAIPVREGAAAKDAVVLLAGGAFSFRGNYTDTLPTAMHLRELGFQTFILDYRLHPYTQEEGALDVARAVRFIRNSADAYGIYEDAIAVMGYSAGGIQAGEFFLHYDESVNGTALDASYLPDALDIVPAHASAAGMIYSFYGHLSVASLDVKSLKSGNLPPTFYCYGTEDPFYRQFEAQVELMKTVGVTTKTVVLDGWPHGFGGNGGWVETYAEWLENLFSKNGQG